MTQKPRATKPFTVLAPPDLMREIEDLRTAMGERVGVRPPLSPFAVAALRRGLAEMRKEARKR